MSKYKIENDDTRPQYNLALEEYLCELAGRDVHGSKNFFMLWRNEPSVIIGRFQDARAEVNDSFIREHGIHVVRRNSGGGAVYHDLGNVNYSFIVKATESDKARDLAGSFASFTRPIVNALLELGLPVEMSGRNDIVIKSDRDRIYAHAASTVEGRKISGGAEWHNNGVILHHGTLLFDCDLDALSQALNAALESVIRSRAVPSIRSRVANIRPLLRTLPNVESFMKFLSDQICSATKTQDIYTLTSEDKCEVQRLMRDKYSRPSWNWNANVQHDINHDYYQNDRNCGFEYFHLDQVYDHNNIDHDHNTEQKSDHNKYDHSEIKIISVKRRFWWGTIECKIHARDSFDNTITSCEFSGDYFSYNNDVKIYNRLCERFVGLVISDLTPAKLRELLAGIDISALFAGAELEDFVTLFTKDRVLASVHTPNDLRAEPRTSTGRYARFN